MKYQTVSRVSSSNFIRLSYWCVTNYVLSQQRFPMNIWQNKFRVPPMRNHWIIWWELLPQHKALHWAVEGQRETKMQVGQTAALYLSLSLTLLLSLSLSLSLVGDKERQRCKLDKRRLWRFSRQIKGIFLTHSSLWHLFDHLQKPLAFPSLSYPARAARWER